MRRAVLVFLSVVIGITMCAQAQATTVEEKTWGTIKALYRTTGEVNQDPQYRANWYNNIVSEAFFALNQYRTGSSNVTYHGWAMSDWAYVESDRDADKRISWYIGGCVNRGQAGSYRWMRDWDGTQKKCRKGGYCRYFVNLVLYRCSYGWGGGKHLVLPRSGTSYANRNIRDARRGWVIQANGSHGPHTAIVVEVYPGGLDVVDSNWVGSEGTYRYLISRHFMSWSKLNAWGFKAYDPVSGRVLISQSGSRTRCF